MSLVVLADENIPAVEAFLDGVARVIYFNGRSLNKALLAGVDALFVRSVTHVDRVLLEDSGVSFVGTATSGFDHVDRHYLHTQDIGFSHAPGSNANSVVEYVLAAVAASGAKLEALLQGGCVGVVGYGHVGRALVQRLQALGIRCRIYDPWLEQADIPGCVEFHEILQCDVVSLHCELTRELPWPSEHLFEVAALRAMKRGALLINASRGGVIDNHALSRVLSEGAAIEVVLDVWEGEPDIDATLLEQVSLGTAHIAGYSADGKVLATRMLCAALAEHFSLDLALQAEPLEGVGTISACAAKTGADLLRDLLQQRYDILADDAALHGAVLGSGRVEARENFDLLRRHYPARRELAGTTVDITGMSEEDVALVKALGCRPFAAGNQP